MSFRSSGRAQWIAAVSLLLVIWSVWYLSPWSPFEQPLSTEPIAPPGPPPDRDLMIAKSIYHLPPPPPEGQIYDKPLILYAYSESANARFNLEFFLDHGIHANADFIFIINGMDSDAAKMLPNASNIYFVQRPNDCYDLGAYSEVLTKDDLWKRYSRFIMLNASVRGPFLPYWAESCWSDRYLNKVNDEVKLVGMTSNCWPQFHVQSMIWATDSVGLSLLLYPQQPTPTKQNPSPTPEAGINGCFHNWNTAVSAEIGATAIILKAGYKADVMMAKFHTDPEYIEGCVEEGSNGDVLWDKAYGPGHGKGGTNVHPYETIFMKTNRDIDPKMISILTEFTDSSNYTSYDFC